MRTKIVSAFPGVGKSHFYNENKSITLDSDSSGFSWTYNSDGVRCRHPDFPQNYINHIISNIGKFEYILVSSHKEVREALKDNCLFFYLIYPDYHSKSEYLQRYKDRGSPQGFIDLLDTKWDDWLEECFMCRVGCANFEMETEFLSSEITLINSITDESDWN
jgi:hypothetical protein